MSQSHHHKLGCIYLTSCLIKIVCSTKQQNRCHHQEKPNERLRNRTAVKAAKVRIISYYFIQSVLSSVYVAPLSKIWTSYWEIAFHILSHVLYINYEQICSCMRLGHSTGITTGEEVGGDGILHYRYFCSFLFFNFKVCISSWICHYVVWYAWYRMISGACPLGSRRL